MKKLTLLLILLALPLLACRLSLGQPEPTSIPTAPAQPTRRPSATPSPTAAAPALDRSDSRSIAAWMAHEFGQGNYAAVGSLIHNNRAAFYPPGVGFTVTPGGNADEFANDFQNAVRGSAVCEGYKESDPGDTVPKLFVYFSGLQLSESVTGLEHDTDIVGFLFLESSGLWELTFVIPEASYSTGYVLNGLQPCP